MGRLELLRERIAAAIAGGQQTIASSETFSEPKESRGQGCVCRNQMLCERVSCGFDYRSIVSHMVPHDVIGRSGTGRSGVGVTESGHPEIFRWMDI